MFPETPRDYLDVARQMVREGWDGGKVLRAIEALLAAQGGRVAPKSEEQPHAIAYTPAIELRSADAGREAVPCASDAERPVQDARRKVAGRPEGK